MRGKGTRMTRLSRCKYGGAHYTMHAIVVRCLPSRRNRRSIPSLRAQHQGGLSMALPALTGRCLHGSHTHGIGQAGRG